MNSILKQLLSLILPFTVLVIVPYSIESNLAVMTDIVSIAGCLLVTIGITILAVTITMLTHIGEGTLAPWSPTRKLVVSGIYSYVRNPMITGVLIGLVGEALTFHSTAIFIWFSIFFIVNTIYFVFVEEPGLMKRFGDEYVDYRSNVPRWIPRLKPWRLTERNTQM